MNIFIQHQGQQTGPFTLDQVSVGVAAGTYQLSDMAWYEGAAGWAPLYTVPGIGGGNPSVVPQTSGLAITSMVLGICSFFTLGLTAIPAVVCGHLARGKIKRSGGARTGGGMALAGIICGYFGSILIIALLAGMTAPVIIRQRQKAEQTEAVHNARQLWVGLSDFDVEYGKLPSDETARKVAESTMTAEISGNSSNAYFRQLIRSEMLSTETPFYAKSSGTRKPDNNLEGDYAIAPGECGFAYVTNLGKAGGPARPMAIAPFIPGTGKLDPEAYAGKAVILWTDGAVNSMNIQRRTGKVIKDGKDLLDPSHPVWGGKPPVIAYPE
ncbi:MAG: DUF4190 domain-containing protein [Verrucomicrobiaceae bacterium]|nr:MAG: DUF4190 domain-containing protein [Verrucomicrobiaceae bacterium]